LQNYDSVSYIGWNVDYIQSVCDFVCGLRFVSRLWLI